MADLEWSQVDMQRNVAWVHANQGKARKSINISLNAIAMKVLRKQIGKHPERVFTYRGKPIIQVNTRVWAKGIKKTRYRRLPLA